MFLFKCRLFFPQPIDSLVDFIQHCALRSLVALIRVTVALLPCLKVSQSGVLTALIGCDMADAMQKKLLPFWRTVQPYTSLQCYSKPRSCSLVSSCVLRYLGISIINQTLTWITGSLMCICDLFACTHTHTHRETWFILYSCIQTCTCDLFARMHMQRETWFNFIVASKHAYAIFLHAHTHTQRNLVYTLKSHPKGYAYWCIPNTGALSKEFCPGSWVVFHLTRTLR